MGAKLASTQEGSDVTSEEHDVVSIIHGIISLELTWQCNLRLVCDDFGWLFSSIAGRERKEKGRRKAKGDKTKQNQGQPEGITLIQIDLLGQN